MARYKILIVDDEENIRFVLSEAMERMGYYYDTAKDGEEALIKIRNNDFDLVILDIKMPKIGGIDVLKELKKISPLTTVVVITAFGSNEIALQAISEGAYDYFTKPFDLNEIRVVIKRALEKTHLQKQLNELRTRLYSEFQFDKIIGNTPQMKEVFELIQRVVANDANVLIFGESGTGKELVAEAIHYHSNRKEKPFVKINCVAIPENLLESELFGYEKGAFTGAIGRKIGKFELAQHGTLFLDEIGDMPLALQAKLLRVVQEREIERVGGTTSIKVDIRIISATNKDLMYLINQNRFREDLYFRLNVIPIYLPPLRERKEDIPLLLEHFIQYYNVKLGKNIKGLNDELMETFTQYSWPGNIRELENVIQRSIILSKSEILTSKDLPLELRIKEVVPTNVSNFHPTESIQNISGDIIEDFSSPMSKKIDNIIDKLEEQMIKLALTKTKNRRQEAADLLGISRKSLHLKMSKYNINV